MKTDNATAPHQTEPAVEGPVQRQVRRLPEKVMGTFPGMTAIERLEADFRRLAAKARKCCEAHQHPSAMYHHYSAMDRAYTVAAEKARAARGR